MGPSMELAIPKVSIPGVLGIGQRFSYTQVIVISGTTLDHLPLQPLSSTSGIKVEAKFPTLPSLNATLVFL